MKRTSGNYNRFSDTHLWDDAGREWSRSSSGLSAAEVEAIVDNPAIRMGVHEDFGRPVTWIDAGRRRSMWVDEIAPRFADDTSAVAKRGARGRTSASLWRSREDQLLVFESD